MKFKSILPLSVLILITLLISCQATAQPRFRENSESPPQNINPGGGVAYIDTHNHLFGGRPGREDYFGAAESAQKKMKLLNIKKMIIMPPPLSPEHPVTYDVDELLPIVREYPDKFAVLGGGGLLNIMIHEANKEDRLTSELKSRFKETALEILSKGAIGLGEFTAEHFSLNYGHPYESAPVDHPLFLMLADIAAQHGVPIDIHMEAIPRDMPLPNRKVLTRSGKNPKILRNNIDAFERLLEHNRNAKIIWAHVGWCNTGYRTPALCRDLLTKHPNLYMSFKISPESVPETRPISKDRKSIRPEWLRLIRDFSDRFVIGTDQFYSAPGSKRIGPQKTEATRLLMNLLPSDLARKLGIENPTSIFGLDR